MSFVCLALWVLLSVAQFFPNADTASQQPVGTCDELRDSVTSLAEQVASLAEQVVKLTDTLHQHTNEFTKMKDVMLEHITCPSTIQPAALHRCQMPHILAEKIEPPSASGMYAPGDSVTVTCHKNHVPASARYVCQDDGLHLTPEWTPSEPVCSPWCPLNVAILLDSCSAMCDNDGDVTKCDHWDNVKEFTGSLAAFLLSNKQSQARVSIIPYAKEVYVDGKLQGLEGMTLGLEATIQDLEIYNSSWANTTAALETAHSSVFSNSASVNTDVSILISAGSVDSNSEMSVAAAQGLKNDNVTLYSVGVIESKSETNVLQAISSHPINHTYWQAPNVQALQNAFQQLAETICNPTDDSEEDPGADIVIVLDCWDEGCLCGTPTRDRREIHAAPRRQRRNPQKIKHAWVEAASNMANNLPADSHVGMIGLQHADRKLLYHDLQLGGSRRKRRSIDQTVCSEGDNDVALAQEIGHGVQSAFKYIREEMFTPEKGARPNAPKVLIFITDGGSWSDTADKVITEAAEAKTENIQITGIGVGGVTDTDDLNEQLEDVASYPASTNVFDVEHIEDLPSIADDICLLCNDDGDFYEITTREREYWDGWVMLKSDHIKFDIMTNSTIQFFFKPNVTASAVDLSYQILVDTEEGRASITHGSKVISSDFAIPLKVGTFLPLWLSCHNGLLMLGSGHTIEEQILLQYHDPEAPVLRAGSFKSDDRGRWRVKTEAVGDVGVDVTQKTDYEHLWMTVSRRQDVRLNIRGCGDAHILLSEELRQTDSAYEITIGEEMTAIRTSAGGRNEVTGEIEDVDDDCESGRDFWVSWRDGIIKVGKGTEIDAGLIVEWQDRVSMAKDVKALSVKGGSFIFRDYTDDDECALGTHDCDANAACINIPGAWTCACNVGYSGTGQICTDDDECALGTHDCDINATCTNIPGSWTCACNTGYTGTGQACTDDDECTLGTHDCDVNATCTNTAGSWTCACNAGYLGTGQTCTVICKEVVVSNVRYQTSRTGTYLPNGDWCTTPEGNLRPVYKQTAKAAYMFYNKRNRYWMVGQSPCGISGWINGGSDVSSPDQGTKKWKEVNHNLPKGTYRWVETDIQVSCKQQ